MDITPQAQDRLRSLLSAHPGCVYRLRVVPGGCQGYTYDLKLVRQPEPDDLLLPFPDLPLYIERRSAPYLEEVVLDYVDGLFNRGFIFQHPYRCHCGQSFAPSSCPSR
ncbi:MAG: iron-sulfur cluster assembly accessory protein [Gloeomargarita sp. SKYG116]|nr:iron-sulfur cluster assembly accessory protein [Gloeomargarita sp. SKYG116]MDW8400808.1 iron-sulfur cluster assembly accessory protein [Gloeomargarita sp. SKYGB_i_bin116]